MKKYFKNVDGDYITATGTGLGDVEITQEEYEKIRFAVRNRPIPEEGFKYRLKSDMTWELVELPPEDTDPELTDAEALSIILGGVV